MSGRLPLAWRIRVAAASAVIPPLLSIVSLSRLAAWIGGPGRLGGARNLEDTALAAAVDRLLRALPWPWRHTCLKRAAVLFYLLRRAGRPVELCIGVARGAEGTFAAHAWLVRDGSLYLEPDPRQPAAHQLIARFPEPERLPSQP